MNLFLKFKIISYKLFKFQECLVKQIEMRSKNFPISYNGFFYYFCRPIIITAR